MAKFKFMPRRTFNELKVIQFNKASLKMVSPKGEEFLITKNVFNRLNNQESIDDWEPIYVETRENDRWICRPSMFG